MTAAGLHLAPDLTLPTEFATEGVAVIGMRGSGKSNTEVRFAEVLYAAGIPFVAIDPKGDWHGIRSSADGKQPGLSVPVFGGLHGDFPLDAPMGARIADLLVDENLSAVLDVSSMSKTGGIPQFLTAFCHQLMLRHRQDPQVRTVILEEAHRYIPQTVTGPTAVLKEAAASLLLEGRAFGLGCWAATQRPARIHKDVLEEVGTAIIHRIGVSATNDKKTIVGWTKHYDLGPEIADSLTSLAPGEAWVLIPEDGIVRRVQMDRRTTFDSAATPKVGAAARRPNTMADIDAGAIKEALADVILRATADDPKALRAHIARLQKELAARPEGETIEVRVEVPVIPDWLPPMIANDVHIAERLSSEIDAAARTLLNSVDSLRRLQTARSGQMNDVAAIATERPARTAPAPRPAPVKDPVAAATTVPLVTADAPALKSGARRILTTLARVHPQAISLAQLGKFAKFSITGGAFQDHWGILRRAGLIEERDDGLLTLSPAGWAEVGEVPPSPVTTEEVLDLWRSTLRPGSQKILDRLVEIYPAGMTRADLAEYLGMAETGGAFQEYLSALRRNGLTGTNGQNIVASESLFLEGT